MRRGARPGLPSRSTPLIVWTVGLVLAVLVAWLVFRLLRPQELQEIGPVGAAFASPSMAGQVLTHARARVCPNGPHEKTPSSRKGEPASHEAPIA